MYVCVCVCGQPSLYKSAPEEVAGDLSIARTVITLCPDLYAEVLYIYIIFIYIYIYI